MNQDKTKIKPNISKKVLKDIEYNEEMDKWVKDPDIEFTRIDNNASIKTNFLIVDRNFTNLQKWLSKLKEYLRYLRSLIDIESILSNILEKLKNEKTMIPIVYNLEIGQITTYTDTVTNINYQIKRVDQYNIEITNLSDNEWYVDRLMICVKNFDGTIVYPVIKTTANKINLYFADGISTSYNVFMI